MTSPDSSWPYVGGLTSEPISTDRVRVLWGIFSRGGQQVRKKLRSRDFAFAGAKWNLFASFDEKKKRSLFAISVRERSSEHSDAVLDCDCDVTFLLSGHLPMLNMQCKFKFESSDSYGVEEDFLPDSDFQVCLERDITIQCFISVKKSGMEETIPQARMTHSTSGNTMDAHTENVLTEKEDEELSMASFESKVCKDLKNLLLSEEYSDVTLQVQDQQFKGHRLILAARSSVFAAMFRHDTKEKATGVVNVEDCEPSAFPVLLEFIYCGSTEKLSMENVFSLYTTADKYDVQNLKKKCLQFIKANLSADTFCETFKRCLQHSGTNLLKLAEEFFIRNCQQIISSPEWRTFLSENPIQGNDMFMKAAKFISLPPP